MTSVLPRKLTVIIKEKTNLKVISAVDDIFKEKVKGQSVKGWLNSMKKKRPGISS